MQKSIDIETQKIMNGISPASSQFDIELYFHDLLVNNCVYDTTQKKPNNSNIYGAIIEKNPVCSGYAKAIQYLKEGKVRKIFLSRPVADAGASIGYLPGDIDSKLAPYIRPLYDCFEYFIGIEGVKKLIDSKIIEVVPITMLRGRTLADSFIVLDEMQNATKEQLKLALTRIGFGSKCVVTYDFAQTDISKQMSCVNDILNFEGAEDIGFYKFNNDDICRAEIVKTVLEVYKQHEEKNA
jgi:phosphate starvation-inducible PhoH-like protein